MDSKISLTALIPKLPSLFFASCVLSVLGIWTYRIIFHPLAKYPGPLLAKVSDLYGAYYAARGRLHLQTELGHRKYGPIFRQGPNKLVFNSAAALHDIYYSKHQVKKSFGYETMIPAPGAYNVFTATDKAIHHHKRKLLNQGFSDKTLRAFEPTVLRQIMLYLRNLLKSREKQGKQASWSTPIDMTTTFRYLKYDLMGEFGFGQSFRMQSTTDNHFLLNAITATTMKSHVYVQYPNLAYLQLEKLLFAKGLKMRAKFLHLISEMVKSRLAMGKNSQNDLFSCLVDAKHPDTGKSFSDAELWAESRFLLIAGADTSATALAGIFFYLTAYPECYERLIEEIRSTFSSAEEIQSGPKLASCHYLRACIDESMRMSPPACGTAWREVCPGGINVEGHFIPPGIDIGVNIYSIHHNEAIYPNSSVYKPERWIVSNDNPKEAVNQNRHAFSSFSLGSRSCAGRNMAYMEILDTVARTCWYLDFKRADESPSLNADAAGLVDLGRDNPKEFQLRDHITCSHTGPFVQFRPRLGFEEALVDSDS